METRSGHDLDKIGGLLSEGLVSGPQKLALEQNILQAEANGLDVKLATLYAGGLLLEAATGRAAMAAVEAQLTRALKTEGLI